MPSSFLMTEKSKINYFKTAQEKKRKAKYEPLSQGSSCHKLWYFTFSNLSGSRIATSAFLFRQEITLFSWEASVIFRVQRYIHFNTPYNHFILQSSSLTRSEIACWNTSQLCLEVGYVRPSHCWIASQPRQNALGRLVSRVTRVSVFPEQKPNNFRKQWRKTQN